MLRQKGNERISVISMLLAYRFATDPVRRYVVHVNIVYASVETFPANNLCKRPSPFQKFFCYVTSTRKLFT